MGKIIISLLMGMAVFCLCSTVLGAGEVTASETGITANNNDTIEEVVVTAGKRSQFLQEVPISIQAFTGYELEKMGTVSAMDLQAHTPGMFMTHFSGFGQVYIRGIGNDLLTQGAEGAVAFYVDGVYQSRPQGSMFNFVDVERVEVLKGPQGTLYGRNTTGGAINIVSRAASREPEGQADVQFGSLDQTTLRATLSGPLSEGAVYGRLSAVASKSDGATKNITLNTIGNNTDFQAFRGSLEFTPSAALNIVLNARYNESQVRTMIKLINPETTQKVNPAFFIFHAEWQDDFYTVDSNTLPELSSKQTQVDATITYDTDWARLTSVTAARKEVNNIRSVDYDGTAVNFVWAGPVSEDIKFFSQDFTLASDSKGPWQWTALGSFLHQDLDYENRVTLPLINTIIDAPGSIVTDAMGIGGQASYSLGNDVTLTAGIRYSKESKKNSEINTVNGNEIARQNEKTTWTAWTPMFVAEYAATTRVKLYASVTKGFKSGGYNTQTIGPAWSPEKVTSYEAGLKSDWFGGKLRVNAAAFYMKYDDLQIQRGVLVGGRIITLVSNAAKATSQGIELDFVARPIPRLEVSGGLQVLQAEFDEYFQIDPYNLAEGLIDRAGNPLAYAPRFTVNIGMQYTWPSIFEKMDVTLRADGYRRSKVYYTPFKSEEGSEELGFLGNVQLSFESTSKSGMYGAVFVKNVSDKQYHEMVRAGSGGYASYPAPPRTYGVQVGYRF